MAFAKRLGESISPASLEQLFDKEHRASLKSEGSQKIQEYVEAYLRLHLPRFPEEGISCLTSHLVLDSALASVADHVGLTDLILSEQPLPYPDALRADTLAAFIALINNHQDQKRAELFIQDFILTQLASIDINELFSPKTPMTTLTDILVSRGMDPPEPRLLRSAGMNTVTPVYVVGIYVNRSLIGECAGETVSIAEDMAARDCLTKLWGTEENKLIFSFGAKGRQVSVDPFRSKLNPLLADIPSTSQNIWEEPELPEAEDLFAKYKDGIEAKIGVPLRKRQRHAFSRGSYLRRNIKRIIKPKPWTI